MSTARLLRVLALASGCAAVACGGSSAPEQGGGGKSSGGAASGSPGQGGTVANTGGAVANTGGAVAATGGEGSASGSPASCSTSADCRLVDDYCTGCDCRARSKSEPDPKCAGTPVNCFVAPCQDHTVACRAGRCVVE